jgi:organic radical activating enzyme
MATVQAEQTRPASDGGPNTSVLFRLPWTAADNAMTWLEPTRRCNITCDACFVQNDRLSDKPLQEIRHELDVMLRLRRCDAMLIAGGEPLVHPQIVDVVRMVHDLGVKPILVTNGVRLNPGLVRELKVAGAHGFTLHVDSHQHRPGWTGSSEKELNELRSEFAGMLHDEGRLTCAFNTTVFPDTVRDVPDIVEWAVGLPDRVHTLTLICVRMVEPDPPYDYYVGGTQVDLASTPYVSEKKYVNLTTDDLYEQIRRVLPNFEFCAFLGGTVNPRALKWVVGVRIGSRRNTYGYFGGRSMELLQNAHHALRHRYLAFSDPRATRSGRTSLLLGMIDGRVRRAALRHLGTVLKDPRRLFERLHVQAISVVQPVDIMPTGEADTCDGCPNKTYWQGRLVPACQAEEYRMFGGPVRVVPRAAVH